MVTDMPVDVRRRATAITIVGSDMSQRGGRRRPTRRRGVGAERRRRHRAARLLQRQRADHLRGARPRRARARATSSSTREATTYGGDGPVVNPSGGLISKGHPLGATGLAQCARAHLAAARHGRQAPGRRRRGRAAAQHRPRRRRRRDGLQARRGLQPRPPPRPAHEVSVAGGAARPRSIAAWIFARCSSPSRTPIGTIPAAPVSRSRPAVSSADEPVACSVDLGRAIHEAQAHTGVGGAGDVACSGDLLLGALAACQLTPRWWRRRWDLRRSIEIDATATSTCAGRSGSHREVGAGFDALRLRFAIDAPGATDEDTSRRCCAKTERYCTVAQTLMSPPPLEVTMDAMRPVSAGRPRARRRRR